jgi:hypothetical protein
MHKIVKIDESTNSIYVIDKPCAHPRAPINVFDKIDWLQLAKQKRQLVTTIWASPVDQLLGLIHLIDSIEDDAEDRGYEVVYCYDLKEWRTEHPDEEI